MTRAGSLGSQCVLTAAALVPPVSVCSEEVGMLLWARAGPALMPCTLSPQLWLFCCRGACAKPGVAQSGVPELVAPHESLCTQQQVQGQPGAGRWCGMCSPVTTAESWHSLGTALQHPSASCSHSAWGLQKHLCQAMHQGCWAGPCREVKSGTRAGQAIGSSPVRVLVSHRGDGAGESTKPMGLFCTIPTLHPGSQVIFNTFLTAA